MITRMVAAMCCATFVVDAANILGIFPTNTHSHYVMYGSLMRELARRGHRVTSVSHFPMKESEKNLEDVSLAGTLPALSNNISVEVPLSMTPLDNHFDIIDDFHESCVVGLNDERVRALLARRYDLVVLEIFGAECFLAMASALGAPAVGVVSSVALPWVNDMVANPDNPSYVPLYYYPLTQRMNFWERASNALMSVVIKLTYEVRSNWRAQTIAEQAFGRTLPPLADMARNFSLILTNSHFSINQVRPFVPQMVEVGGLHIGKPGALPQDLKEFLDGATRGAIYFSFGSMLQIESFPSAKLRQIISALGRLEQRVLWKVNATNLPPLPSNVKTGVWMPQLEILCHPATRLFISHGGLLGSQEAITCGVPMLGIPLFADQALNLAELEKRRVVKVIDYENFNQVTLYGAIEEMINDTSYAENMKYLSKLFTDRPQHPMDTAIYWLEYVIKYGGAKHMRSAALDLKWYEYLLLDVIAFFAVSTIATIVALWWCFKKLLSIVLKRKQQKSHDNSATNNNNNHLYQNGKIALNSLTNGHSLSCQNGTPYFYCNGTMYSETYKKHE